MKKLIVLPALATLFFSGIAMAETLSPTPVASPTPNPDRTAIVACVARAVDTREVAVAAAFSAKSQAISNALTTRRTALAAAWAMTDAKARNSAIRTAWSNYNKNVRTAQSDYRKAITAAWKQFRADAKTCKASPSETSVEASGSGADLTL